MYTRRLRFVVNTVEIHRKNHPDIIFPSNTSITEQWTIQATEKKKYMSTMEKEIKLAVLYVVGDVKTSKMDRFLLHLLAQGAVDIQYDYEGGGGENDHYSLLTTHYSLLITHDSH
jgi:virulence-associated protein VagC